MAFAGTLLLYSFIYLGIHKYFPGTRVFFILALVLFIVILLQKPKLVSSKMNLAIVLLFAVMTLSVPFSSYKRFSLEFLIYILRMSVIAFITYSVLNSMKKLTLFIMVWLSYHLILVINTLLRFDISNLGVRYGASGMAASSFLGDANDFALGLNIALPFAFYSMIQTDKKLLKYLYAAATVLLIMGIVISNSRGGFITLLATSAFIWYQNKKKIIGLIAVAVIGTGIFLFAPQYYIERMETITTGEAFGKNATGGHRISHLKAGLKMMIDHPFTGVGLGRFSAAYGTKYHREGDRRWRVAHNSYISIGAETGIFGFLLYFYLLYLIFKENYDLKKSLRAAGMEKNFLYSLSKALTAGLFAYCVGALALTAWYYIHIYLMIALALVIRNIMLEEYGFEIQDNTEKNLIKTLAVSD